MLVMEQNEVEDDADAELINSLDEVSYTFIKRSGVKAICLKKDENSDEIMVHTVAHHNKPILLTQSKIFNWLKKRALEEKEADAVIGANRRSQEAGDSDDAVYGEFNVNQLKDMLRERELSTSGNKSSLILRLETDDDAKRKHLNKQVIG